MNKDLHDIDDLFRSALGGYEETASATVKEKLDTALDKKYNKSAKRKFTGWKKTTLCLLLLLAGLSVYDPSIFRPQQNAGKDLNKLLNEKNIVADQTDKSKNHLNKQGTHFYDKSNLEKTPDQNNNIITAERHHIFYRKKNGGIVFSNKNKIETGNNRIPLGSIIEIEQKIPEQETRYNVSTSAGPLTSGQTKEGLPAAKMNAFLLPEVISIFGITDEISKWNKIKKLNTITDSLVKKSIAKATQATEATPFKPFWMLTAFASYETAGYRLDSDIPNNITNIKHSEVQEPSFSVGILTTRQLKKHWGLQTGLVYSQTDIGITPQKLFALQDPAGDIAFKYITSSGYAYIKPGLGTPPSIGDSLTTTEGKHRLKSISIPLILKYSVAKGKLTITPGAGAEATFVASAKIETEVERPFSPEIIFINKLDGAKQFYVSLLADAEVRYKLNTKLSLSLRPALRFAVTPVTKNNVVETFPRSVGIGIGLTRKF